MRALSPSLLGADFTHLADAVDMINRSDATWLHIDVMDGCFVPNISFGFPVMEAIRPLTTKPLDVHLMIVHPEKYVERFVDAGAYSVGFHLEAVEDPRPILEQIRAKGAKTCLTINPDIPVERLFPYLKEVDMVLLMSVYAGFGGQKFIPDTFDRLRLLREEMDRQFAPGESRPLIQIDGGVNLENAEPLFRAGADVLVAGNAVFRSPDPVDTIHRLVADK